MFLAGVLCSLLEPDGPYPFMPVSFETEALITLPSLQRKQIPYHVNASGFCIDSLNASFWAFDRAHSFDEAVLSAVNLGDDADTVGAITGQLAGAKYGVEGIPPEWINQLAESKMIIGVADNLYKASESIKP
jgi:ADP-ribosyl-[dinitrogen reductase] hydrolase